MTPEVQHRIEQIRAAFPGHAVHVLADGQGGAHVVVDDLELGPAFAPATSWVGFTLDFQYPRSDVYPHFLRPDLAMADGRTLLSPPLHAGQTMPGFGRAATMISRRSTRRDPARDTAALKLLRVLHWFHEQAPAREQAA